MNEEFNIKFVPQAHQTWTIKGINSKKYYRADFYTGWSRKDIYGTREKCKTEGCKNVGDNTLMLTVRITNIETKSRYFFGYICSKCIANKILVRKFIEKQIPNILEKETN